MEKFEKQEFENAKKAKETADEYAKSRGKSNINELTEEIREGLNSGNEVREELAKAQARAILADLTKLILKQEYQSTESFGYLDFVNYFDDGVVKEGNSKMYQHGLATGKTSWQLNKWIPDAHTAKTLDKHVISIYTDASGLNLTPQAYQFKKNQTIEESQYIPYFKAGNMGAFISDLYKQIDETYKMFIFDKIATLITSSTPAKTVSGTATNAFECWVKEILPLVEDMKTASSDFNYKSGCKVLRASNQADIKILVNPKVLTTLKSGIESQVFNAKLFEGGGVLDISNFINLGKKFTVGDQDTPISVESTTYYIPENTIYIINTKNCIKHIKQVQAVESQFFAENLTTNIVKHVWGAVDFLPWAQIVKYTSNKLNELP